jgi:hypothetical protein
MSMSLQPAYSMNPADESMLTPSPSPSPSAPVRHVFVIALQNEPYPTTNYIAVIRG